MQPIALPSLGGMASVVTMFIVPCLFCAIEEWKWKRAQANPPLKTQTDKSAADDLLDALLLT